MIMIGGCVRAIFALLKTSCLLPYYVRTILKVLSAFEEILKYAFNARNTYLLTQNLSELSVRITPLVSLDIDDYTYNQKTNYLGTHTQFSCVCQYA